MVFTILKGQKQQKTLDTREAYNLWDLLKAEYTAAYRFKVYQNDTHDVDLNVVTKKVLQMIEQNIKYLEEQMIVYSIPSPDRNRITVNFPRNSQAVSDELLAGDIFIFLQESIEHQLRAFRTSVTSSHIRDYLRSLVIKKLEFTDKIAQYLKLKGWIETPPLYNELPANVKEVISTVEVFNLFDHLAFRYDNMHTTEIMHSYAFDGDFKLILKTGNELLTKQAKVLERELEYFGIPLPKRSSQISVTPRDTEILNDDHMFRTLLIGVIGATILHTQPIKEGTVNDRIRQIFRKLLIEEMELLDKLYNFGVIKGWLHEVPLYLR